MFRKMKAAMQLSRAEKYFAREDYHRARGYFAHAVELDPQNPAVNLRYAVFLSETNDLVSAVSHAQRALSRRPKSAPYHLFYGRILFDHNRAEEAREHFEEAARLNAKSQLAKDYLALVNVANGQIESGLAEMKAAGLSQNTGFHARTLVVLEKLVRFGDKPYPQKQLVVEDEEYCIPRLFRDWKARGLLSEGIYLLDTCKWDEAVRKFRKARALSPGLIEALYQEGVAYFMAEDYARAEVVMSQLVEEGDEPAVYLAGSVAEQGRYEEAAKILENVARQTPEYHYYLGLCLLSGGQDREARYHFEKAAGKRHDLLQRTFERAFEMHTDNK